MLFTRDRTRLRNFYRQAYRRVDDGEPLEPLQALVADVIREHPEYHYLFAGDKDNLDRDFPPEDGQVNPWLHMSMHVSLREQVGTDRPAGIAAITRALLLKHQDGHEVEHLMFDCLGETLWVAQRNNAQPDDATYLVCLRKLWELYA